MARKSLLQNIIPTFCELWEAVLEVVFGGAPDGSSETPDRG